ncbi:MAG TPA: radical SAM family heme chaperone HemW [Rhabdochlamydiaceae bacterium]|jgi:oxygen-independent coproporphyrinogen-3 oxidase
MPKTGNPASLYSQERLEDISLYFHIPFCLRKCPYCHFFVLPDHERFKAPFLSALHKEWDLRKAQLQGKRIVSIYFGGGTPTKLSPLALHALLDTIAKEASLCSDCEITLEANPEDVSEEKMRSYAACGINRISLGVQSLIDAELGVLGRQHTAQDAIQAVHSCYQSGLRNISIDLMYELPSQTLNSWLGTIAKLHELPITHLSLYNLTFEPNTIFFKKSAYLKPSLPTEEESLAMLNSATVQLENIGLKRYEISAFARIGCHSRHNTGYWLGRPFLGFGPSAFSYWDKKRFSNHSHFQHYVQAVAKGDFPVDFEECLSYPKNVQELLAVQLRLIEGVDLDAFQEKQGRLPQETLYALEALCKRNWLCKTRSWQLTQEGLLFYDSIASALIS